MSETSKAASISSAGGSAEPDNGEPSQPSDSSTIPVAGMTCAGCAENVHVALSQVAGVGRVEVDVNRGEARVHHAADGPAVDDADLRAAVERIGYAAARPSPAPAAASWWKPAATVGVVVVGLALGVVAFRSVNEAYTAAGTLQQLNAFFGEMSLAAFGMALVIGLVVAFAPSSLAMAPAIMGYISTTEAGSPRRAAGLSALFLAGMLLTTMTVGALFALGGRAVMRTVTANLPVWYGVVAVVLVAMALMLLGVWRPRLAGYRPSAPSRGGRGRAGGAFVLGVPFGLMACPSCTPLLLPLALGAAATANPLYGAGLLGVFALGRGVPMIVLGTFTGTLQAGGRLARGAAVVQRLVGVLLLVAAGWFAVSALTFSGVI